MEKQIKVGCEAYIIREEKILLGKRGNVFGKGTWALPGGHLEYMERADQTIIRELQEEMGIMVEPSKVELLAVTDDLEEELHTHYIHLTFKVAIGDQEPSLLEPEACEEWRWFDLQEVPEDIFPPHQKIFQTIESQAVYATLPKISTTV